MSTKSASKVEVTAERAYARYVNSLGRPGHRDILDQIVDTAYATGHWEAWFKVFGKKGLDYLNTPYALEKLQERCTLACIENSKL